MASVPMAAFRSAFVLLGFALCSLSKGIPAVKSGREEGPEMRMALEEFRIETLASRLGALELKQFCSRLSLSS